MTEWLGNGLQNRLQQFESAWHLKIKRNFTVKFLFVVPELLCACPLELMKTPCSCKYLIYDKPVNCDTVGAYCIRPDCADFTINAKMVRLCRDVLYAVAYMAYAIRMGNMQTAVNQKTESQ